MAKRAASDEKPFRPLDTSVLQSVMKHTVASPSPAPVLSVTQAPAPAPAAAVVELTAPVPRAPQPPPIEWPRAPARVPEPVVTRLDSERRILFTRDEARALDRLVQNLAVRLNAQVKVSHVIRALTMLLLRAETSVDVRAGEKGALTRPPNGDFAALQKFEREIASVLSHALRDAGHFS